MRKALLAMLCMAAICFSALAQKVTVTGKVTDSSGAPIAGASISEKGTKNGVSANNSGSFTLSVKPGAKLVISATGFLKQEVTADSALSSIVLKVDDKTALSEVVVTALGIKRQAKELGYATAKVGAEELTQAKGTNVATGLAAKVSGLQINLVNNGVKAETRITLRGNRSFLGNNQALIVIDDIQADAGYLNSINPNDVENVTVLKGASASALYGSAAANGVLIVTTKKANRGKPRVTLSSTVNLESIAYMPKFQNEFGQFGGEFPDQYEGLVNIGVPYIPGQDKNYNNIYVPYENQNYGPRFNGQRVPLGPPIRIYNPDGTFSIKQDSINYSAIPNAKKDFFQTGVSTVNDIAFSAGDEKSRFYLSFEDVNTTGVIPEDKNHRNTIRINGSREAGIFRADYTMGYTINHSNTTSGSGVPFKWGTISQGGNALVGGYTGGGSYFQNRPLYFIIINQPADVDLNRYREWKTDPFASPDGYFNAYYGNPWWQIDQTRLDEKNNDIIGNVSFTLTPTKWLNLNYKAGIIRDDYSNKYTKAGYTFAQWAIDDTLGSGNIPSGVKKLSPAEGDATSYNQQISSDFLATAHKGFGDFDVRLIAGTSLINKKWRTLSAAAGTLVIPDFYNISNRLGEPDVFEQKQEVRTLGVFGDLTVGYKNWLFVHGSVRNDWTSLLAPSNNSFLYPSIDAAFVFTDAFQSLQNQNILSFGKLRLAYTKTAQVSINAYNLKNTFDPGAGFPFGSTAGYTVDPSYKNPNIKPETSLDQEIGLDLGFFKNRVNVTAAYYVTHTKDQTIPITISSATGYNTAFVNSGQMDNKGIELDLKITPLLRTKDGLRWDVGFNFSHNENKVIDAGSQYGLDQVVVSNPFNGFSGGNAADPPITSIAKVGLPYGQLQSNDWARDPQGRIIVDPVTGYPTLDPKLKLYGTANPPTKIGITTSVSYKGFTLSGVADGRFGGVIYNAIGPSLDFTGVSANSAQYGRQPFVIPNSSYLADGKYVANTNIQTKDGAVGMWASKWNTSGSSYMNSADFWKLREVALTYTFAQKTLKDLKVVKGASVSIVGRNLATIRAKGNVWTDPEFSNTNGNAVGNTDLNQLPPTKFLGFNVTITF